MQFLFVYMLPLVYKHLADGLPLHDYDHGYLVTEVQKCFCLVYLAKVWVLVKLLLRW